MDIPAPLELTIESYDSEEENAASFAQSARLKKLQKRDKNAEAIKAWELYSNKVAERKEVVELLDSLIQEGVAGIESSEFPSEKSIRYALKRGSAVGLKWKEKSKYYCTVRMKDVYKLLSMIEGKAREEKEAYNNEKAYEQFFTRVTPLGTFI